MKVCISCKKTHKGATDCCSDCQDNTVLLGDTKEPDLRDDTVLLSNSDATKHDNKLSDTHDSTVLLGDTDSTLLPISEQKAGILFNRYEIESILGKGGMGTVYLVKDLRLKGKYWAIKETVLNTKHSQEFVDEAKMLVELEHSNLPKIIDYYAPNENGLTYLVMDYIKGKTLSEIFEDVDYKFQNQKIIKYTIQLCNLLDYLHTQNPPIIYRDLKPSNIMVDEKDNVQLIDFGIAREYQSDKNTDTTNIGTMGFAAPEQFEDNVQTDSRTDLYSLGATLFYLLTGGRHYISTQLPLEKVNPDTPQELCDIVNKLLKTNPANRYQSAIAVKDDFTKLRISEKQVTEQLNKSKKEKKPSKPKKDKKTNGFMKKVKRFFISLIFLSILAAVGFGAYKYFEYEKSALKVVESFEQAIIDKNSTQLATLLTSADQRVTISEKEITALLTYWDENPSELSPLLEQLYDEANGISRDDEAALNSAFNLTAGEEFYYIIPTYKIEVTPIFITINVNRENTKIYLNDEEIASTDSDEFTRDFGPYLPGIYKIQAVWESDLAVLTDKQSLTLMDMDEEQSNVEFDLTGKTISLNSNYSTAEIYVNDEKLGLTIDDADPFGPILTDGSMTIFIEQEFPWGLARSEAVTVRDENELSLDIEPLTDELKDSLFVTGNEYVQSVMQTYNTNDLTNLNHINSSVSSMYSNQIDQLVAANATWVTKLSNIVYDLDSMDMYENSDGQYEVTVNIAFQYDLSETVPDSEAVTKTINENQKIVFVYNSNQNKWIISNMIVTNSRGMVNNKQFDF